MTTDVSPEPNVSRVRLGDMTIAYEVLGSGPAVAITPGGRFSMATAGVRELAVEIAAAGYTALIWDRPNCGHSTISFDAENESVLWADTLVALLENLHLGPAVLVGGSAGSRVSLLAAARHPAAVNGLYLFWISGGTFGLMTLGVHYVGDCLMAVTRSGMPAVAKLPTWRESIEAVPENRARILAQDPIGFRATMESWIEHYVPPPGSPVPGMTTDDFAALTVPVRILRSGTSDVHHPRVTSDQVHALIPQSTMAEPPWGDDEWNDCNRRAFRGGSLFERWPLLAPEIVEFLGETTSVPMRASADTVEVS